jgi:dTDP-4-dehydrorhamnose reductase
MADSDNLTQALDRIAPDLIVNAAAYTAVDRAEDEPERAMRVNADAVGVLGAWAARHAARVVHYSTDYVFDGSATHPYREDDPTRPLGVYGRSKLAGERALRESGARHLILRTAWVYGARGRNFLCTMLKLGAERDELRVVDDQIGAPTSAGLIADVTACVVGRWFDPVEESGGRTLDGTYHLVAAGQTSWCGFARAIFERVALVNASAARARAHPPRSPFLRKGEEKSASHAQWEEERVDSRSSTPFQRAGEEKRASQAQWEGKRVSSRFSTPFQRKGVARQRGGMPFEAPRITPIATADYPTKATRPAYSVLDTAKLRETFGIELPDWQTVLDRVIAELRSA